MGPEYDGPGADFIFDAISRCSAQISAAYPRQPFIPASSAPAQHPPRGNREIKKPPGEIARRHEKSPSGEAPEGPMHDSMKYDIIRGVEGSVSMNDLTVTEPANADAIRSRILTIRGVQVMLDRDLAELYGVPTKRLNEQVKRNARRFPDNFMFQLTKEELADWRSQIATSNVGDVTGRSRLVNVSSENWRSQIATSNLEQYAKMGVRNRPYAFAEHGIIMLASVLKSDIAIDASIRITNAFIAMRKALSSIAPLMARIVETERLQLEEKTARLTDQARNEERFKLILDAMQDKRFPPQKHGEYAIVEMCKCASMKTANAA